MAGKILLTGAPGFIGQWLAKALLAEGADLRCLMRRYGSPLQKRVVKHGGDNNDYKEEKLVVILFAGGECF
jgi:nucleoside-diphosphate-sugar epimerase